MGLKKILYEEHTNHTVYSIYKTERGKPDKFLYRTSVNKVQDRLKNRSTEICKLDAIGRGEI